MSRSLLVFPHQLFPVVPEGVAEIVLVEDDLFFTLFGFHRKKLLLHRASMSARAVELRQQGLEVNYVSASPVPKRALEIAVAEARHPIVYWDVVDDWLSRRLRRILPQVEPLPSPGFLTPLQVERWQLERPTPWRMGEFYIRQRRAMDLMVDAHGQPQGGRWSFDSENRKRLPKGYVPPPVLTIPMDFDVSNAAESVLDDFPHAVGSIDSFGWPVTRARALAVLDDFLEHRFRAFGDYEDALSRDHAVLNHSQLSIPLNLGLITPAEVIERTLAYADSHETPLNSLEGFIRQIIGWREFMRLSYERLGRRMRTTNFWGHTRQMPPSFYTGTTGIPPVDTVIRRVLNTGYAHHIERLMILGNFMLLCEIDPDDVYRWFMELFVDAYDWVMVPNVYAMSQFADGGLITTKPYLSGSAYIRRMSDYPAGEWCEIWDALYWRFIARHREFFEANPRLSVMPKQWDRFPASKQQAMLARADQFLANLDPPAERWASTP